MNRNEQQLHRRHFIQQSGAALATAGVSGNLLSACGTDPASERVDPGPLQLTCGLHTAPNIEGPFFTPDSPERQSLLELGFQGQRLRIRGQVFNVDCEPLAGALLDFWQADHEGAYDNQGYTYRGHQFTTAEGRFDLETIVPGRYLNGATYRPAHIHVKAAAQGLDLLTTQLYFADDPFNGDDPWYEKNLELGVDPDTTADDALYRRFDFVLG